MRAPVLVVSAVVLTACPAVKPDVDPLELCRAAEHCVEEDGHPACEEGYDWEDRDDPENYRCVPVDDTPVEVEGPISTKWNLPPGGSIEGGFYDLAGHGGAASHRWSTFDIDGDGLPDLVVTARVGSDNQVKALGFPDDPYWAVHRNTGAGFEKESRRWALPRGGDVNEGFYGPTGSGPSGSMKWSLLDMDGDLRPDLVITARTDSEGRFKAAGGTADPHWRVHRNTGTGFQTE